MILYVFISLIIGLLATLLITPKFMILLERIGLVGTDIQKLNKPSLPEMGGLPILVGTLSSIFTFIWLISFLSNDQISLVHILAAISTIMIITIIGILDDLSSLIKSKSFKRIGLKQWQKPLLTLPAAIPLMAIMAGQTKMSIPFIGTIEFGILYPLVLVPIAIVGASNATNMLAGLNGLEAGLGTVILSTLGIYAYVSGSIEASLIAFSVAVSLLAFLYYNWYPSKIFPGDSLTYMIGATIATVAIIGNIEKIAFLAFIPWFIEFVLKARSRFKAESFGKIMPNKTLEAPYNKIYSLTHIPMKLGKFKEWQISTMLIGAEIILCISILLIYIPKI
jgi:UDP-N-acetylglucosamine--dolichyl-phosphate N-acetylglucosaminephosphotransferase